MFTQSKHCPNPDCKLHETGKGWFIKKGYFKTKRKDQQLTEQMYEKRLEGIET